MIGYLQGEILEHADGRMLIAVGDRKAFGSIGYSVSVPQSAAYGIFLAGQRIELFVHTHVREDALDLYGFGSSSEKALFLTLLGVNGIGPKSALGILSAVEVPDLIEAIIQGDQAYLTRIPGIGKRTAERVVVELRDGVKKKVEQGAFGLLGRGGVSDQGKKLGARAQGRDAPSTDSAVFQDAKAALVGLGYKEQDIHHLLNRVLESSEARPRRAEDLIKTALRQLA
jgi:Holliday junction DNA helicase RuvA